MKFIKTNNEIISLENVLKVSLREFGTGAKSNPLQCYIDIYYTNCQETRLDCGNTRERQAELFEKIATILAN